MFSNIHYVNFICKIYNFRFSIDKDSITDTFVLDLAFIVTIDGVKTEYIILTGAQIAIPVCNDSFTLPGNGTVDEFVKILGDDVGQMAIDMVLMKLGFQV